MGLHVPAALSWQKPHLAKAFWGFLVVSVSFAGLYIRVTIRDTIMDLV